MTLDKKDKAEVVEIVQETIKMYFDEKQKREAPKKKNNAMSYFTIFAMGGVGLYIVYLMADFMNQF